VSQELSGENITLADLPLRDDLRGEVPYGAPQLDVPVLLNVNENPYPPSEAVVSDIAAAVARAARGVNRYPDREFHALRADLANFLTTDSGVALTSDQVWAANGSNEVMQQLLQAFGGPGRTALSFAPTYSMYPEYARNTNTNWVTGHRESDFSVSVAHAVQLIEEHQPSVVILTSPNNPTGTALPLATIEAILAVAPGVVVVDEAYAEFRREGVPSALSLLSRFGKLIVTRTMSKAFAYAGGRLGYLASSTAVVDAVRIVRLPYHLSAIQQAAARAALAHGSEALARVEQLRTERDATVRWLRATGWRAADSDANFVLFGTFADRHAVWQGLLDRGVLIRETGPDGWLRVSIGTADEMAAFRSALIEVTGEPLAHVTSGAGVREDGAGTAGPDNGPSPIQHEITAEGAHR
jgi:histidinol-phosphate aminotransferase